MTMSGFSSSVANQSHQHHSCKYIRDEYASARVSSSFGFGHNHPMLNAAQNQDDIGKGEYMSVRTGNDAEERKEETCEMWTQTAVYDPWPRQTNNQRNRSDHFHFHFHLLYEASASDSSSFAFSLPPSLFAIFASSFCFCFS